MSVTAVMVLPRLRGSNTDKQQEHQQWKTVLVVLVASNSVNPKSFIALTSFRCGDRFCGASQAALRRSNDLMQSLRVSFWFEVQDAEQAFSIT